MQHTLKAGYEKCLIGLTGTAWTAGLLVAGSDSPYMPWLNCIGLILFFSASVLLGKLIKPLRSSAGVKKASNQSQKQKAAIIASKQKNRRINTRLALGI